MLNNHFWCLHTFIQSVPNSLVFICMHVITSGGKTHNPPGGYPAADERLFSHPSDIRVDGGWVLPSAELARIMIHSVYWIFIALSQTQIKAQNKQNTIICDAAKMCATFAINKQSWHKVSPRCDVKLRRLYW